MQYYQKNLHLLVKLKILRKNVRCIDISLKKYCFLFFIHGKVENILKYVQYEKDQWSMLFGHT